jgi:hypothetical protein
VFVEHCTSVGVDVLHAARLVLVYLNCSVRATLAASV